MVEAVSKMDCILEYDGNPRESDILGISTFFLHQFMPPGTRYRMLSTPIQGGCCAIFVELDGEKGEVKRKGAHDGGGLVDLSVCNVWLDSTTSRWRIQLVDVMKLPSWMPDVWAANSLLENMVHMYVKHTETTLSSLKLERLASVVPCYRRAKGQEEYSSWLNV